MSRNVTTVLLIGPLACLLMTAQAYCGAANPSVFAMLPKETTRMGFVDLTRIESLPWFPQFEAQNVPVPLFEFEKFLAAAQLQQAPSIEQVVWAWVSADSPSGDFGRESPGQLVAIATGHFDFDAIQFFLASRKAPALHLLNYTLYDAGVGAGTTNIFFAALDDQTIAFGPLLPLKRMLLIRSGNEESLLENDRVMSLVDRVDPDSVLWSVTGSAAVKSFFEQLIPNFAGFAKAHEVVEEIKRVLIVVRDPSDFEVNLHAEVSTRNDAAFLEQLLQVGLMYKQYQTSPRDSALSQILNDVRMGVGDSSVDLSLDLNQTQILSLIEHNLLASAW